MRLFVGLACLLAAPLASTAAPPNVVLILADDFGYECVGANGGRSYQTPNLDKLAATGVRFTHAFATPLCTPSRVTLMTGRYNCRNYVSFGHFDYKEQTFAHALKGAGYKTFIAGKWQLEGGSDGPNRVGFDEFCVWQITAAGKGSRYANPAVHANGKPLAGLEKRYGPDVFLEHVQDFISRNKREPFLVYWPEALTHDPFDPTPDSPAGRPTADKKNFPDMVAYLDKLVGKLVAHLEKEGVRDNTLILFTGDNGTLPAITSKLGDRDYKGGKGKTTTAGTHVPLIANWPGRTPAGKVCDDLIDFTDILPTLADAAGAAPPKGVALDGRSFLPQVRGEKGSPRESIFCHYEPRQRKDGPKERYAQDHRYRLFQDGRLFALNLETGEDAPVAAGQGGDAAAAARAKLQVVLDRFENENPFGKP